ncbi:BTAD domain-containing putative transcriptional regulator [Actinomadura sp. CNU-125]|uniref:BTAD domain-containing putative transcriptional regulator n=1 Tax=Actinomadura sp. CNU-125 TaxID=1904961 RepID=UPI0021CC8C79|nr:BTAD domain-containing putative transcriptional regulator [Actinomadura sp. CNU-125]
MSAAPGYALRLPDDAVDAWRFGALVRAPGRAAEALALWRGPAFAEFADDEWARAEIVRLDGLRTAARERHVADLLRAGDAAGAVSEAELLTRDEPLREEGWRLLALALRGAGRQADALAALREARAMLADELGLDPGPALADTETAILRGRADALDVPAPAPPPAPEPAPEPEPFFGRDDELAALTGLADRGDLRVALVTGEAGLGKTALLDRLSDDLERRGRLVVTGRCPESDGAPAAWAWTEALTALARHVPAPDDVAPLLRDASAAGPRDTTGGRFRLHRAVWTWLADAERRRPLAVMLDDLHWADAETLALLAAVSGDGPLLVVAAFRAEETGARLTEALAVLAPVAAAAAAARAARTGRRPARRRRGARRGRRRHGRGARRTDRRQPLLRAGERAPPRRRGRPGGDLAGPRGGAGRAAPPPRPAARTRRRRAAPRRARGRPKPTSTRSSWPPTPARTACWTRSTRASSPGCSPNPRRAASGSRTRSSGTP